jgi:hypothetical protein
MIHVVFEIKNKRYRLVRVSGHAGYDDKGKDIVCAGVSALLGGLLNSLEYFLEDEFDYQVEQSGWSEVILPSRMTEAQNEKAYTIIKTFELGIKMLQADYPNYVRIHEEEVDCDD